jgi:alkanesulfonate monooxygenase SsuD/methylene tetrahydromethanopterin reductase-like flavin-dependent oxidoreductase (luciferase family)
MGATLRYAKVIDREDFQRRGAEVRPGLESVVHLSDSPPAATAPFYVLWSWDDFDAFTETWRIVDPHGRTVYEPVSREVLAGQGDLADQIEDLQLDYGDDGYQLVLEVDGREVARTDFPVREPNGEPTG